MITSIFNKWIQNFKRLIEKLHESIEFKKTRNVYFNVNVKETTFLNSFQYNIQMIFQYCLRHLNLFSSWLTKYLPEWIIFSKRYNSQSVIEDPSKCTAQQLIKEPTVARLRFPWETNVKFEFTTWEISLLISNYPASFSVLFSISKLSCDEVSFDSNTNNILNKYLIIVKAYSQ